MHAMLLLSGVVGMIGTFLVFNQLLKGIRGQRVNIDRPPEIKRLPLLTARYASVYGETISILSDGETELGYIPVKTFANAIGGVSPVGVQEMAITGSAYRFVEPQAFMVRLLTEGENPTVVGNGFRWGDYLITAAHVAEQSSQAIGPNPQGTRASTIPRDSWKFALRADVAWCIPPPGFFAYQGVKACPKVGAAKSKTQFVLRWFDNASRKWIGSDGKLDGISGETWGVHHTASTKGGASGAPLISQKRVVGIHLGSAGGTERNRMTVMSKVIRMISAIENFELSKDESSNWREENEYYPDVAEEIQKEYFSKNYRKDWMEHIWNDNDEFDYEDAHRKLVNDWFLDELIDKEEFDEALKDPGYFEGSSLERRYRGGISRIAGYGVDESDPNPLPLREAQTLPPDDDEQDFRSGPLSSRLSSSSSLQGRSKIRVGRGPVFQPSLRMSDPPTIVNSLRRASRPTAFGTLEPVLEFENQMPSRPALLSRSASGLPSAILESKRPSASSQNTQTFPEVDEPNSKPTPNTSAGIASSASSPQNLTPPFTTRQREFLEEFNSTLQLLKNMSKEQLETLAMTTKSARLKNFSGTFRSLRQTVESSSKESPTAGSRTEGGN